MLIFSIKMSGFFKIFFIFFFEELCDIRVDRDYSNSIGQSDQSLLKFFPFSRFEGGVIVDGSNPILTENDF